MKKSLLILVYCLLILNVLVAQNLVRIDSLTIELNKANTDTLKANFLNEIAWEYKDMDPQKSIELSQQALLLSAKNQFIKGEAIAYNNIGNSYNNLGKYNEAILLFDSALTAWNKTPNFPTSLFHKQALGNLYNNKGIVHRNLGNYQEALSFYLKSLEIDKELNNQSSEASSYNNIGIIYYYMNDLDNTILYFEKALELKKALKNYESIPVSVNNIAAIYLAKGEVEKSIQTYEEAIKLYEKLGNKKQILITLGNIGAAYIQVKNYTKAKIHLNKSLAYATEINDQVGEIENLINIAFLYSELKELNKAVSFLDSAKNIAGGINSKQYLKDVYSGYVFVYKSVNNFEEAYNSQLIYENYKDSLLNENKIEAIAELETKFETNQKEKELAIAALEKKKQNAIIWAISIGLLLIIVFTLIIVNRLRVTKKQKILIEQKNKENELLLGEIHHRVKNNLQVISSLLSLQERSTDDEATKSAIAEGKERVKSMGLIHKMLYQNDNYSGVEMDNYGQELIKGLMDSFGLKEADIDVNLNFSHLKLDVDTAIPIGLIINELVINSLKYAYKKTSAPSLKISLTKQTENLILEVTDNGNGKLDDLENSKSFGMKLIKSLSRQIGGTVSIENNAGISVRINISDYKLI